MFLSWFEVIFSDRKRSVEVCFYLSLPMLLFWMTDSKATKHLGLAKRILGFTLLLCQLEESLQGFEEIKCPPCIIQGKGQIPEQRRNALVTFFLLKMITIPWYLCLLSVTLWDVFSAAEFLCISFCFYLVLEVFCFILFCVVFSWNFLANWYCLGKGGEGAEKDTE